MDSFLVNFVPWNQRNTHGELYLPGSVPTKEIIVVSGWNHAQPLPPVGYGQIRSEAAHGVFEGQFLPTERGKEHEELRKVMEGHLQWSHEFVRARGRKVNEGRDISRVDVLGISPVLASSSGMTGITQSRSVSEDYMPGWAVNLTDPQRLYVASRFGPFIWEDEEEEADRPDKTDDDKTVKLPTALMDAHKWLTKE